MDVVKATKVLLALTWHLSFSFMDVVKATKELLALTSEMNCDQTAIGLPHTLHTVFVIAK
jgi:hypothetical protein